MVNGDSFETSTEEFKIKDYSRDRVYSRATNQYGIGTKQSLTFPSAVISAVQQIVQKPETPYRTQADFIRDSVVHNLHYQFEQGVLEDPVALRVAAAEELTRQIEQWESLIKNRSEQLSKARNGDAMHRHTLEQIRLDLQVVPSIFDWAVKALEDMLT